MRKGIKALIIVLVALVLIAGGTVFVLGTRVHKINSVNKQMKKKYGVTFTIKERCMDEKKTNGYYAFVGETADGIYARGYCNWKGDLVSESYVHFYYSSNQVRELNTLLTACFDDQEIVRDCVNFQGNHAAETPMKIEKTKSYEDYKANNTEKTCFRVYLKKGTTDEQLQQALDTLAKSECDYEIYFMEIDDAYFQMTKDSDLDCYYPASKTKDILKKFTDSIDPADILTFINEPNSLIIAKYIPSQGVSEITR